MNLTGSTLTEFNFADHTILIVDDVPANLGVITDYLESFGFRVVIARNGASALERVKYAHPDIILLDVEMPVMDGFEACLKLKLDETTKDIPVIFMTALSSIEEKVKGFEVGAVDYVIKPIQSEEVLARIITHLRLRNLTRSLQQANTELAELNATKDKFFSIVAHDLRGPFSPLLGMSKFLLRLGSSAKPEEIEELATGIHTSAENVYNLLENLLHWSRLERGLIEHHPTTLDLREQVEAIVGLLAENAEDKDIDLQNKIAEETSVYADKNMLDTVLRNLTSNALKFTGQGGQVTISARLSEACPEFVEVVVADNGVGISEENLTKLFKLEENVTTRGTAREKGSGLGLILCQEMIDMNGGSIAIESKVDQGTAIKFTIPHQSPPSG